MPKGTSHIIALILIVGGVLIARQFDDPHQRVADYGTINSHRRGETGYAEPPAYDSDGIAVYFSPSGGCEAAVVSQITAARRSIDVQAYSFTSSPIAEALADAQDRGVTVRVIVDYKAATSDANRECTYLQDRRVPLYTDGNHPIAHNKVMILDGQNVITGSFNFTYSAEHENAENLVVFSGKRALADAYERNFEEHLSHSEKFSDANAPVHEHSR